MSVGKRDLLFLVLVVISVLSMGAGIWRVAGSPARTSGERALRNGDLRSIVTAVDTTFGDRWARRGVVPAAPAPELAVMRRLSVGLCGTIPSLEEIRRFESRPAGSRVEGWLDDLLHDRRFADYLAERFARAFVGTEDGPFLLFRRRRFIAWLSDAFLENRPYDAIVRDLIADRGLWTDHPATNFVSVTFDQEAGRPTPERLGSAGGASVPGRPARLCPVPRPSVPALEAGRFPRPGGVLRRRAFRPARHPRRRKRLPPARPQDQGADRRGRAVRSLSALSCCPLRATHEISLPPGSSIPGTDTSRRRRSTACGPFSAAARWPSRSTTCRLFRELHPALVRLADDFASHGYDLHRLIRIIAATEVFRLDSATAQEDVY